VGASDLIRTVMGFGQTDRPLIAKGNAGIPKYQDGHIHYNGTPDLMAEYAVMARDAGATIIGGCCGTTPAHLEKMRAALESRPKGAPPELDRVAELLGGFSSDSDGTDGRAPTRDRSASRRRRARG
jgi:5-methyltetrahydrofolate--homocysteine methyltransferase